MREILFRGKEENNGKWAEGSLHVEWSETDRHGNRRRFYRIIDERFSVKYVDPETVGQYTGMIDKHGKKIFEGDIVSFKRENALGWTTKRVGDVRYYDELPIFYIMATTGDAWDWVECYDIEVIGNVHDNPELLEVQNEIKNTANP